MDFDRLRPLEVYEVVGRYPNQEMHFVSKDEKHALYEVDTSKQFTKRVRIPIHVHNALGPNFNVSKLLRYRKLTREPSDEGSFEAFVRKNKRKIRAYELEVVDARGNEVTCDVYHIDGKKMRTVVSFPKKLARQIKKSIRPGTMFYASEIAREMELI